MVVHLEVVKSSYALLSALTSKMISLTFEHHIINFQRVLPTLNGGLENHRKLTE